MKSEAISKVFIGETVVRETDEGRLEQIYDQFADPLFRYALALTNSSADAEDAVQEVFVRLAREAARIRRISDLKAYLYSATRNAAYSVLRSRKRRGLIEEPECAESDRAEAPRFEDDSVAASVLRDELCKLPLEQREVLVLKVVDQMTFREIAEVLGVSMNTVTARYRYGIEKLRRALESGD